MGGGTRPPQFAAPRSGRSRPSKSPVHVCIRAHPSWLACMFCSLAPAPPLPLSPDSPSCPTVSYASPRAFLSFARPSRSRVAASRAVPACALPSFPFRTLAAIASAAPLWAASAVRLLLRGRAPPSELGPRRVACGQLRPVCLALPLPRLCHCALVPRAAVGFAASHPSRPVAGSLSPLSPFPPSPGSPLPEGHVRAPRTSGGRSRPAADSGWVGPSLGGRAMLAHISLRAVGSLRPVACLLRPCACVARGEALRFRRLMRSFASLSFTCLVPPFRFARVVLVACQPQFLPVLGSAL